MNILKTLEATGHKQVLFCQDEQTNLKAIIAIHDTSFGRAMGATRLWPYASEEEALQDALRLSRGMSYKAACANIPVGGAKGVIIAQPEEKTEEILTSYARFVDSLKGLFITGQDVNLCPEDVRLIGSHTPYVVGLTERSGGPAPITAKGVLVGIKTAVDFLWGTEDLTGLKVAIQGVGNVGKNLCQLLHENGAEIWVTDLDTEKARKVESLYGAKVVPVEDIYSLEVDVFSPCGMGGIINDLTIPNIQAKIIAGAGNNQLENELAHSQLLKEQNILYCPDYVINSGGLINVYNELIGYDEEKALKMLDNIGHTLFDIFHRAREQNITAYEAANFIAEERVAKARKDFLAINY
ncbi:Glu/Leu/Phe/Val dehydrogenase dimerization domain-containing protein [Moorena sp. SIO3I6]|uniref:Glu/Leu/Phe/Val dehydrogenase dimerization domain-containing protein n=1 Tax=Moorena sp. SIO3I6 TaxID=2607831 RepID=UPI0013F9B5D7|nr:Glu/Leu/Phe/Val dehydrogenase dimerization domain-containing protein [Moorena sp. SIO3I6]NEP23124.1 Glu/Leu/Phe/Val dehydrogenase [Moorena sp. SIO3I6]